MVDIRPKDLPAAGAVNPTTGAIIIDDGVNVARTNATDMVNAVIPLASQAEAEAATDNAKRVSPLRVKQYVDTLNIDGNLAGKQPLIIPGTTAQYYRGDKTFQTLDKNAVALPNVDNTSDASKPISTATQTALNLKAPINNPTFTGTVGGVSKAMVGLSDVDNTSDANKPVSTAQATAIGLKVSTSTLALGTGSSLVGYTAPSGVLISQDAKNRQIIDPREYGAVMDGATNDRAALITADANGPVRISKPTYIATSMTFTNPVEFVGNGRLVGPSTTIITIPYGLVAQKRLIFDGVQVTGLFEAHFEWFAADVRTSGAAMPSTDCKPRLQRALDAVAPAGVVRVGVGNWLFDGATAVVASAGQSFEGSGYGLRGTAFYWAGVARNFITKIDLGAGTRGGIIRNFALAPLDRSTVATTSTAISVNQSDVMVRDVVITNPYTGIAFISMVIGRAHNTKIAGPINAGYLINNSLDVFVNQWNVSAGYDIVTMTGAPSGGDFVAGEAVNCPTGSNGIIVEVFSSTKYGISWVGIPPPVAGTINATGKTATVSAISIPSAGGHIRLTGVSESVVIGQGDGIGGEYGLRVVGSGSAGRIPGNSGFNVIEAGAYFDTTYSGSIMDGAYGTEVNGWFSTTRKQDQRGLALFNCRQITGAPRCENNAGSGIFWDATSKYIYLAPRNVGNGRLYTLGNTADITVSGLAINWSIIGGFAGHANLAGVSAPKGLYIDNAGAGNFSVIGIDVPAGAVTNSSTADSQYWFAVAGMPWRVDKSGLSNAANDAAAAAASVPIGGIYRNGSVMMIRMV